MATSTSTRTRRQRRAAGASAAPEAAPADLAAQSLSPPPAAAKKRGAKRTAAAPAPAADGAPRDEAEAAKPEGIGAEPVRPAAKRTPAKRPAAKQRAAVEQAAEKPAAKKTAAKRAAGAASKQGRKAASPPAPSERSGPAHAAEAPARPRRPRPDRAPGPVEPPQTPAAAPSAPSPRGEPALARACALRLVDGDERHVVWSAGANCPATLADAARDCFDEAGRLRPDDDEALLRWLRLASSVQHAVSVDDAVWPHLAARRDLRRRLAALQAAYRDDAALGGLSKLGLAPYQIEGALWSVVAGRALLADEPGLGKGVQAIAAARLWQRHFGVERVLVLCAPAQRAAWQRAWWRVAGVRAQMVDATDPARADQGAAVRIAAPDVLPAFASPLAAWAPQLLIVDEPQLLGLQAAQWAQLDAPHALVLCGAALDEQPELLNTLVEWLDRDRLGPLAALREVQAARERGAALADADIARLDAQLSRLLLQRQRAELEAQLPRRIYSERLVALPATQREAHDRACAAAQRLIAGWRGCGWIADADQWQLARALHAMRTACHRVDPLDPHGALADHSVDALRAQLDEWALGGTRRIALRCESEADRVQLASRIGRRPGLVLVGPGEPLPDDVEAVLQVGVPWCADSADGADDGLPPGRQWMLLVAQDSIDSGLFDTLALRRAVPAGPGEAGFLEGEALQSWLTAVDAALGAATNRG
jgi:hypothetical protein